MKPVSVTVSSVTESDPIALDWRENDFKVALGVILTAGATLTYSVQHTFDDIQDSSVTPVWLDNDGMTDLTATDDGNYAFPVKACRLEVSAYTGGSATLTVIQAGGR